MQRFTQERGQSRCITEKGAASRMYGSIDLNQDGFLLRATEFTNIRFRSKASSIAKNYDFGYAFIQVCSQ
jgi:hypothetical protein